MNIRVIHMSILSSCECGEMHTYHNVLNKFSPVKNVNNCYTQIHKDLQQQMWITCYFLENE